MADKKMYKVGITVKEPWSADISYEVLDITLYAVESGGDGCSYTAIKPNQGVTPGTDDTVWVKSTQAGQSIYDLAVKYHHFVGTEEEFEQQYQDALAAANNAASAASATDEEIKANELSRVSAENDRVSAEQSRVSAEQSRVSAESARVSAENARVSAESSRESAEATRASNESARVTAENGRVSAEQARVSAEQSRLQQFEALKTDMNTAIANVDAKAAEIEEDIEGYEANEAERVSAEQSRVSAESSRVSAESARAAAETARAAQASSDHTRAETDHSTAESDHTTATGDHTQAGTDHTQAASDHTTAAADHTRAEADHTASETATQAATDAAEAATEAAETIDEKIAGKANTDGYYGGMTVGSAENLVGRGSVEADYAGIRTSAGSADIGSGSATITRMKGRSFKWNQLVNSMTSTTNDGITTSYDSTTHLFSIINDSRTSNYGSGSTRGAVFDKPISGHIYAIVGEAIQGVGIVEGGQPNTFTPIGSIRTSNGGVVSLRVTNEYDFVNTHPVGDVCTFYLSIHDLTAIFGHGNEPETVEEFDAWREEMGLTLDYYDYNAGEIINNRAQAIETVGYNLYDASTGKAFLPGEYSDYPQEYEICGTFTSISFRDVNGNESVPTLTDGRFFNVNAPGELTVVGGNATDTLVHLVWSGWRNYGEPDYAYEAYWKNTLNLGLTTLTGKFNGAGESVVVFPNGLAKIGDVQDEIVGGKAIRRIGSRAYASGDESDATVMTDGHALTYYVLTTPEEYVLDETPEWNYRVDDFGTERVIPSYSPSELTAPIAYDVQYAMNAVDAIRRLDTNYVRRDNVKQIPGQSETDVLSQKAVDDNYARKVGLEENLVAGLSRKLAGKDVQTGEFATAVMSGADGLANINEVMGKSLVRNQLLRIKGAAGPWTSNGVTMVNNRDGSFTFNGTATAGGFINSTNRLTGISLLKTHKYFVFLSKVDIGLYLSPTAFDVTYISGNIRTATIVSPNNDGDPYYRISVIAGETYNDTTVAPFIIDLTLMFGAGNEPSTVEEFEALFPLPYYDYNAGEIISNNTEALEITGFNQWDEEWEVGAIDSTTGAKVYNATSIRSKNDIEVLQNTTYFYCCTTSGVDSPCVAFLDSEHNTISTTSYGLLNRTFVTPTNCKYIRFSTHTTKYGNVYKHDICINVSGSRNGEYEPYQKSEFALNLPTITGKLNGEGESVTIFPDGMRSAGTAYDYLVVDNDGWCRKAIKRIGVVDSGTLNWSRGLITGSDSIYRFMTNSITQRTKNGPVVCVKYPLREENGTVGLPDKTMTNGASVSVLLYIRDDSYTSGADFIAAMQGVLLYYELATPLEYVLDTPIQMTFQAKHGGVIRQKPENGSEPTTAPMRMSVTYALDAVSILSDLPENYVSKESLQAMLSAMQSAGLFAAYTMTFNESTNKYEFTFTANA